ncbi:MAG: alcohol dehydrogenase catalytic domain-containing protein [Armatimonadota bacterium]|nr:alcohol dehydrogenase catalytic domain-containing protein [Armatimonadota bacterium]
MKAVVFYGPGEVAVEERPLPSPGPDEVLVRVQAASVCGTDVRIYRGEIDVSPPVVLGHDFAGVVEKVGEEVEEVTRGMQVVVEPIRSCGACRVCMEGRYNLCPDGGFHGFNLDGGFSEYALVHVTCLHDAQGLPVEEAGAVEPVVVALASLRKANPHLWDYLVVFGQGPIGLTITQVAKLQGLRVIAVDPLPRRLDLAREMGADHVVNPDEVDPVQAVLELTGGNGADVAIEASGTQLAVDWSAEVVRPGGKLVFVGEQSGLHGPPMEEMMNKELETFAVALGAGLYPRAIDLLASGKVQMRPLITHTVTLEELPGVLEQLSDGTLEAVKVLVKP